MGMALKSKNYANDGVGSLVLNFCLNLRRIGQDAPKMSASKTVQPARKSSLLRRLFPLMLALVMACGAVVSLFTLQVFDQQVSEFNKRVIAQEARIAAALWRDAAQKLAARTFSLGEAQAFTGLVPLAPTDSPAQAPDRRMLMSYMRTILQAKPEYMTLSVVVNEPSGSRQFLSCSRGTDKQPECISADYQPGNDPLLDQAIAVDLPTLLFAPAPASPTQARFLQSSTPFSNFDFRIQGHILLRVDPEPIFDDVRQGLAEANRVFLFAPGRKTLFFMDATTPEQDAMHARQIFEHIEGNEEYASRSSIISPIETMQEGEGLGGYALGVLDPGTTRRGILQQSVYLNLTIQLVVIGVFMLAALLIARHVSEPIRKLRLALQTHREDIQESDLPASADYDLSLLFDVILENSRRIKLQRKSLAERYAAQKVTHQQLEKALQRIQRAELDKNELVKVTAHDLREPLLVIISCSRMLPELIEDGDDEGLRQSIGFIEDNVMRMMAQVERMRRYFRIGISKEIEFVGIRETCILALSKLNPALVSDAHIDIRGDATLRSRSEDIRTVLTNLLENALTHARGDRPLCVTVTIEEFTGGCNIAVADNGVGIPQERHEKIFDLFSRGDSKIKITGTGTGLSEVRHIAYLHGGDATLTSNPEGGVTFKVVLYHLTEADDFVVENVTPPEEETPATAIAPENQTEKA